MQHVDSSGGFVSTYIPATDGLRLHARCYGKRGGSTLPVLCLPGLARTAADFDMLATTLASDARRPRRVIALDYRGRGLSEYDRDPAKYNVQVELGDVLTVANALEALPAVFIGTSRGGILTMLFAAQQPGAIAGAVLNDIGPVLELEGLKRIKGYVGKLPQVRDFDKAAEALRRLFGAQFPALSYDGWLAWARRSFRQDHGALAPTYDVNLAQTLAHADFEKPMPALWPAFDALASVPLLVIRGANSDLLSAATVEAMRARRKEMDVLVVPDQGHAPLLAEPSTIARIADFVAACDGV